MAINVYWACLEESWMLAEEPQSVSSIFNKSYKIDKKEPQSFINYCPAFNNNLKNVFALRSVYDYSFKIIGNDVVTDRYDQTFFDEHVTIRSLDKKFFSFRHKFIFFTDEPSLQVVFYEFPFLEDNNITERCIIPAGSYDIGQWFRNTEFSFFLKKQYEEFIIEKGEIYSYIRFKTNEKINFSQFRYTEKLNEYNRDGFALTKNPLHSIQKYYKNFKNKKLILKEIKENLI